MIPERHPREEDEDEDGVVDVDGDEDGVDQAERGERRPSLEAAHSNGNAGADFHHSLSRSHLTQHNTLHAKPAPPLEWIVVRIEVTDTGCGIRPKDMVQSKLFCAFTALCVFVQALLMC